MELGPRLRRLRLARGLTQQALAAPRYTHAYVSTIEAGRRVPSRTALEHFARTLNVSIEELETGRPSDLLPKLEMALQEARSKAAQGSLDEAEAAYAKVERDAKRFSLPRIRARAVVGKGNCAERRGAYEEAIATYEEAESLLDGEPSFLNAETVAGQARCHQGLGDNHFAIHVLERLLRAMRQERAEHPDALVRVYAALVQPYFEAGMYRQAADAATSARRYGKDVADPSLLATMHVNVARVLHHQGQLDDAVEALQEAQQLFSLAERDIDRAIAHLALGYILARESRLAEARRELERAQELIDGKAAPAQLAIVLNELGRIERLSGKLDEASSLLSRSLKVARSINDAETMAAAHRELGICHLASDPKAAEKHLKDAISLYERMAKPVELAVTYRWLGDLAEAEGHEEHCKLYRDALIGLEALI
jgi:tetratricopeptide (TPR) repeat protein